MIEAEKNNPKQAGQRASEKAFSECYRYAFFAIHTRFDAVQWLVADVDRQDQVTSKAEIVMQGTYAECVAYLDRVKAAKPFRMSGWIIEL